MNIPQSAIAPFEPHGIPTLSPIEPPVHNWQEDLIFRIRRSPTREVWYLDTCEMHPDRASLVVSDFKKELEEVETEHGIYEVTK